MGLTFNTYAQSISISSVCQKWQTCAIPTQMHIIDLSSENNKNTVTIRDIVHKVITETRLDYDTVFSKNRKFEIAKARFIIWYFAKKYTDMTYSAIGKYFNKDHSSVMHGISTIKDLYDTDKAIRSMVDKIAIDLHLKKSILQKNTL